MSPDIFSGRNVVIQGISGRQGSFHTKRMLAAGTDIIAGTSPTKAGSVIEGVPVYARLADVTAPIDISVIFVPAPAAKAAMFEAITANVKLIICVTEGVPVHDMLRVRHAAVRAGATIIGPNCPGVSVPGIHTLGIIPDAMTLAGDIAVVSRSGTLTYEVVSGLSARGKGQKYIIGIGGDRVCGIGFDECLTMFEADLGVRSIVLIGEIGGSDEHAAARVIKQHITKPVYAYIAGHSAPVGVQLGHAGAILGGEHESAASKTTALRAAGVHTTASIVELVNAL